MIVHRAVNYNYFGRVLLKDRKTLPFYAQGLCLTLEQEGGNHADNIESASAGGG